MQELEFSPNMCQNQPLLPAGTISSILPINPCNGQLQNAAATHEQHATSREAAETQGSGA